MSDSLWPVDHQAPPSMGFSRQEYGSGLPFPSPGDLPDPGIKPRSPALQADTLTSVPPGKPLLKWYINNKTLNSQLWELCSFYKKWTRVGCCYCCLVTMSCPTLFNTMDYSMPGSLSSVTQSCPTLQPHGLQHTRLPCPSPNPRAYLNWCPPSRWCHPTISSSVIFSSWFLSFPA